MDEQQLRCIECARYRIARDSQAHCMKGIKNVDGNSICCDQFKHPIVLSEWHPRFGKKKPQKQA